MLIAGTKEVYSKAAQTSEFTEEGNMPRYMYMYATISSTGNVVVSSNIQIFLLLRYVYVAVGGGIAAKDG